MDGIEIDHGDADLSAGVHNGEIAIGIGHNFESPIGYEEYLGFSMTRDEAVRLRDWLSLAIERL